MSPIGVRPYSSFDPECNSPGWANINVISPSVASHYSFYSDNDTNEGFRSPRLALQTSNLLGLGWQERHVSEGLHTPISGSAMCTPISPSAPDELGRDEVLHTSDLQSPRLELLTSDFLGSHLHYDPDALYTPISPSASDDQDGDHWMEEVATEDVFQFSRLALLTDGESKQDTETCFTPISPSGSSQHGEDERLHEHTSSYQINNPLRSHSRHHSEIYTPISPNVSILQSVNEPFYARFSLQAHDLPIDHSRYSPEALYTPISPSNSANPSDDPIYKKLALQTNHPEAIHARRVSDTMYTPISASASVQRGWEKLMYDIATPADRFFIPDFDGALDLCTPELEMEMEDISIDREESSTPHQSHVDVVQDSEQLGTSPLDETETEEPNQDKENEGCCSKHSSASITSNASLARLVVVESNDMEIGFEKEIPRPRRHSTTVANERPNRETDDICLSVATSNSHDEEVDKITASVITTNDIELAIVAPPKDAMIHNQDSSNDTIALSSALYPYSPPPTIAPCSTHSANISANMTTLATSSSFAASIPLPESPSTPDFPAPLAPTPP